MVSRKEEDQGGIELGENCLPKIVEIIKGKEMSSLSINSHLQKYGKGGLALLQREKKRKKKQAKGKRRGGAP